MKVLTVNYCIFKSYKSRNKPKIQSKKKVFTNKIKNNELKNNWKM